MIINYFNFILFYSSYFLHILAASDRFRKVSHRLANSITPCLLQVSSKLHADNIIGFSLNDKMINGHDIDSDKAINLVSELERGFESRTDPETYLDELCTSLRSVGETQITEIVNTLKRE